MCVGFNVSLDTGLSNLPYTKRLEALAIDSLEIRRLRYDLTFVYKMLFGLVDLNFSDYFTLRTSSITRAVTITSCS